MLDDKIFNGLLFFIIGFFVTVPFAIWKWIDIIVWFAHHVNININ